MSSQPNTHTTPVALAVGTHTWGSTPESFAEQEKVLEIMRKHNITRLDTARMYGMGDSELAIGNKKLANTFEITTKVAYERPGEGAGKSENILISAQKSWDALGVKKVPIYLLHSPDHLTPVEETYGAVQKLYEEGRFEKFGLSNFPAEDVLTYYNYAKSQGFVLPTVYQSSYSLAVRLNETQLFPTLRSLGISIQAYSPMAAGFLAKTPEQITNGVPGRWDAKTPAGMIHRHLFFKPSYLAMLEQYGKLAEESGAGRVGLAYRWVMYHSVLDGALGDEMIFGGGSAQQLQEAILEVDKGPLEDWVVKKVDELWELVKSDAPVDNLKAVNEVLASLYK